MCIGTYDHRFENTRRMLDLKLLEQVNIYLLAVASRFNPYSRNMREHILSLYFCFVNYFNFVHFRRQIEEIIFQKSNFGCCENTHLCRPLTDPAIDERNALQGPLYCIGCSLAWF